MLSVSDSVGIRTQDPQLRRLLLYPTELPNRSLCFPFYRKVGAKVVKKIVIASGSFKMLFICGKATHGCGVEVGGVVGFPSEKQCIAAALGVGEGDGVTF